jgi:hypothetical protein
VENASKSTAEDKAPGQAPPRLAPPPLSRWRQMQIPVIASAVYGVIRLIGPTLQMEVIGVQNAVQIRAAGEPGIGAFWHRCIFSAAWAWRDRGIVVLNTVNFDGQWTKRVIERLGFGTAQGSSSRGGIEGLTAMAKMLEQGATSLSRSTAREVRATSPSPAPYFLPAVPVARFPCFTSGSSTATRSRNPGTCFRSPTRFLDSCYLWRRPFAFRPTPTAKRCSRSKPKCSWRSSASAT